jgi:glycosyltransferase involved in cell wall biosynthesis
MKIAYVLRDFGEKKWFGIQTVVYEHAHALRALGHSAQCWLSYKKGEPNYQLVKGIPARMIQSNKVDLGLELSVQKPDLVHFHHQRKMTLDIKRLCHQHQIPYVVTLHKIIKSLRFNLDHFILRQFSQLYLKLTPAHKLLKGASTIICINKETLAKIQWAYPKVKAVYMENGVDYSRFSCGDGDSFRKAYNISPKAKIILCVARIDPEKNQLQTIRIFQKLKRIQPDAHLVLVGHIGVNSYFKQVTKFIVEAGLQNSFTHVNKLEFNDPMLVNSYHAADVFLLTSVMEECVLSVLEAWCAKCPVVIRNNRTDYLIHEQNGFVFEPNEDDRAVQYLNRLLSDPNEASRLAQAGHDHVLQNHLWDVVNNRLLEVYESTLQNHKLELRNRRIQLK